MSLQRGCNDQFGNVPIAHGEEVTEDGLQKDLPTSSPFFFGIRTPCKFEEVQDGAVKFLKAAVGLDVPDYSAEEPFPADDLRCIPGDAMRPREREPATTEYFVQGETRRREP